MKTPLRPQHICSFLILFALFLTPPPHAALELHPTAGARGAASGTSSLTPPVQLAPSGIVLADNVFPTYTWEPVTGADWYALSVYDLGTRQNEYSTAVYASVCTATLCSFRSTEAQAALPNGRALGWYVAAVDAAGTGPWGGGKAFYVFAPPPAPTLITPSGDITTQTPIYRWERKPDSEWVYYLIVLDGYANVVFQQIIINPSGACDINECQVGQSASLYYWYYSWFLAAGNPAGWGPYSMRSFRTVWNPSAASTFEP